MVFGSFFICLDSSSQLCLACANLCHKHHDDFLDQELNRTKGAFKHELNDVIGDENTGEDWVKHKNMTKQNRKRFKYNLTELD